MWKLLTTLAIPTTGKTAYPAFSDGDYIAAKFAFNKDVSEYSPRELLTEISGLTDIIVDNCAVELKMLEIDRGEDSVVILYSGEGSAVDMESTLNGCDYSAASTVPVFSIVEGAHDAMDEHHDALEIIFDIPYSELLADFSVVSDRINEAIVDLASNFQVVAIRDVDGSTIGVKVRPTGDDTKETMVQNLHHSTNAHLSAENLSMYTTTAAPTTKSAVTTTAPGTAAERSAVDTTTPTQEEDEGLGTGAIVSMSFGGAVLLAAGGGGIWYARNRKKEQEQRANQTPRTTEEAPTPLTTAAQPESPLRARSPRQQGRTFGM